MEYLEIYRDKLSSRINGAYDENTKVIRFEDGTEIPGDIPLTMVRPTQSVDVQKIPTGAGFDMAKHYSFASLAFLIASTSSGTQLAQYINQARKMHIAHLPFVEDLSATTFVQLSQGATAPQTGMVLANSTLNTADYMTMMKSIFNEVLTPYISEGAQKRKADKIGGDSDLKEISQSLGATQQAVFKPECPIIIVPAALSLTFNFKNLGDLFANGKFIKANEPDSAFAVQAESNGAHMKKFNRQSVSRPGSTATFELCSDPETLSSSQWNRVVGVVVTGKGYQLESFSPFKRGDEVNTPALFEALAGVFLYFDGDKIPPTIQQWNVTTHKFSQSKRHQDEVVMSEIWEKIIQFCKQRARTNPNLLF